MGVYFMKTIGDVVVERLLQYMEEQKLTQYKLAKISYVPLPTVKSIMQRRTKGISLKTVIMFSKGLGITPSEFMDYDAFTADDLELE